MDSDSNALVITSRNDFQQAIRDAFAQAADAGCKKIWLCDVNYSAWPLGEAGVVEALTRWAYSHRKLTVIAHSFDEVVRRHPRWVRWRKDWAHVVDCLALEEWAVEQVPAWFYAPGLKAVRLLDPVRYRAVIDTEPAQLLQMNEHIEEVSHRAVPAFPATTLGL